MGYWDGEDGQARIERLKELATQGLSCAEIANEMSGDFKEYISRNAVIGKLARMKIVNVGPARRERRPAKERPPKMVTIKPRPIMELFVAPIEDVTEEPPPMIDNAISAGVDYLKNPPWGCKALIGRRGSDGLEMCCGQRRGFNINGDESAYCPQHHRAFHTPKAA